MSAIVPAPIAWPAELALPDSRRKAMRKATLGLIPHADVRGTLRKKAMMKMARLPSVSEKEAHQRGKMEDDRRNKATERLMMVCETSKS
jgi:hypothetical protein